MTCTVGSLFAGIGGFDLGMEQAGFTTAWQVEWDKHCQQILARHWPTVPRWADVRDTDGHTLPPVDVITFGSPCQDLSVAGKRAGLDGERSGLFHHAIRIIKEMRHATGTFPRIAIWENVAGALSSNKGDDFATVLDTLADIGALVIEWHILDARWFGVPQRRRRVFVTAVFDPAIADRCGHQIFPVGPRSSWNPPTGGQKGTDFTNTLTSGLGSGGPDFAHADAGWPVPATVLAFSHTQGIDAQPSDQHWPTLRTEGGGHAVAITAPTLTASNDPSRSPQSTEITQQVAAIHQASSAVRRLTPIECERLQGFPDNWTNQQADSHRYRQLGNAIAVPCAHWTATHLDKLLNP